MIEKSESQKEMQAVNSSEDKGTECTATKRPFIEPEISVPVNVLEATTFLQAVDSGGTG